MVDAVVEPLIDNIDLFAPQKLSQQLTQKRTQYWIDWLENIHSTLIPLRNDIDYPFPPTKQKLRLNEKLNNLNHENFIKLNELRSTMQRLESESIRLRTSSN